MRTELQRDRRRPILEKKPLDHIMSAAVPDRFTSDAPPATSRAVLLIDADEAARTLARRILEEHGFSVTEATGGRDALDKLRAGMAAGFVVTDLKMSDGSGGWLLAQLGYEFPALLTRTLLVSADAHGAAAAHVAARWRCPMLAKPFTPTDLVGAIRRLDRAA